MRKVHADCVEFFFLLEISLYFSTFLMRIWLREFGRIACNKSESLIESTDSFTNETTEVLYM